MGLKGLGARTKEVPNACITVDIQDDQNGNSG